MAEKRRLNVLLPADGPQAEPTARTLMPEVLPNPRSHLREGSARQRTMRQLERLRTATAPAETAPDGDEEVESEPRAAPRIPSSS